MATADHAVAMPSTEAVEDSQQSEQPPAVVAESAVSAHDDASSPWEYVSSPEGMVQPEMVDSQADEEPVHIPSEDLVLHVNDKGGDGFERCEDHHHEHHHVHVRKTILKDNGNHFHLNRTKRIYVTEVHHHHHIHIKHIHIYDKNGKAWFSRFATSSDGCSDQSEISFPASQSTEVHSDVSDSQE